MHWREVVVRAAAKALDEVGLHETATHLRTLKIPVGDGGGLCIGEVRRDGTLVSSRLNYQTTEMALSRIDVDTDTIDLSLLLEIHLDTKLVAECRLPGWLTKNEGECV